MNYGLEIRGILGFWKIFVKYWQILGFKNFIVAKENGEEVKILVWSSHRIKIKGIIKIRVIKIIKK